MRFKMYKIGTGRCPFCGEESYFYATAKELEGFEKYLKGEGLIQEVMPNLPKEKREVLISGICLQCQRSFFDVDDQEEMF